MATPEKIEAFRIWVHRPTGQQWHLEEANRRGIGNLVELRCAGVGWRWHDQEGNVWDTGIGTSGPVWRLEQRLGAR